MVLLHFHGLRHFPRSTLLDSLNYKNILNPRPLSSLLKECLECGEQTLQTKTHRLICSNCGDVIGTLNVPKGEIGYSPPFIIELIEDV